MLSDIAKQQLSKAGWYEGRRIDRRRLKRGLSVQKLILFPAAEKFFAEFGDLTINDKYYDNFDGDIYVETSITYGPDYSETNIQNSHRKVGYHIYSPDKEITECIHKRIICIGQFCHGEISTYISEDGMFYANWYNYGLVAENTEQFWNEFYGEEYGHGTWDDLAAGHGRSMFKKDVPNYI